MTRYSEGRLPDDQAIKRLKAARRVSMIIGLALAVAVAATMYTTLFWMPTSASPRVASPTSASPQVASPKPLTLRQWATFTVGSVPDSVQIDPHSKVVVAVTDNSQVIAWSTSNWRQLSGFASVPDSTPAASRLLGSPMFSPDGQEFSVIEEGGAGDKVIDIWNVTTGQAVTIPPVDTSATSSFADAAPGPGGLIAWSYSNGMLYIDATATGRLAGIVSVNPNADTSELTFSPDGKTIAVSDDLDMIYLVNVPGKRVAAALSTEKIYNADANGYGEIPGIDSIAFSLDNKLVACGSETGFIHVWDVATGRSVSTFNVNGGVGANPVKTLIFSPDGKTLVTANNADGTLEIWDVASGRNVATLNVGSGSVVSAAFTADGNLIVATIDSDSGHKIEIWGGAA